MRGLLGRRLTLLRSERSPYLAIEYRRPDLDGVEAESIAAGEIPAIGARMVYERA